MERGAYLFPSPEKRELIGVEVGVLFERGA